MDEFHHHRLPHNLEAEQSVLGSILIDPRCIPEVIGSLHPGDFYIEANRNMYETMYSMYASGGTIDPVTVMQQMRERGVFDERSTKEYILQLMELTPTAAHIKVYCEIVRDMAMLRQIAEASADISALVAAGEGTAAAVLDAAEQKIFAIRQGRSSQSMTMITTLILDVYERLNELASNRGKLPGLPTGLPDLDNYIGGLGNSNLILVASRPGMGKTSIALNIALHAARVSGKAVAFFSLEMSGEQLATRLLASDSAVNLKKLITGALDEKEYDKIAESASALSSLSLLFDDNSSITVPEMKAKCRRIENLGLIVIDYLQLMQGSRKADNRTQEVSDISRNLKIMAKELNVPVLCLSQLSRANESRANKRPMLSDLRESGAIEQDADIVIFLYREDYYADGNEAQNEAECIVAKNRHGETGTIHMQWLPQYTTFRSTDHKHI